MVGVKVSAECSFSRSMFNFAVSALSKLVSQVNKIRRCTYYAEPRSKTAGSTIFTIAFDGSQKF